MTGDRVWLDSIQTLVVKLSSSYYYAKWVGLEEEMPAAGGVYNNAIETADFIITYSNFHHRNWRAKKIIVMQ